MRQPLERKIIIYLMFSDLMMHMILWIDPNGNITVKWDIMSWTPDGYVAVVTMNNFQMYRHIMSPGWTLGWMWARKEVIWAAVGAEATEQGDCSCWVKNARPTCGRARVVPSTIFLSPNRRRRTQALMTWNVTCTYSQLLAKKYPSCCVSLSSFYNSTVVPCPSCTCGCHDKSNCVQEKQCEAATAVHTPHVMLNYKDYWRVKVSIPNFNYRMNYTLGTLVIQHPNFNNVTQVFSFDYKPLIAYDSITGKFGHVQSEMLLKKDKNTFTFREGWAFPRKVYFNGDECQLPPPDVYPFLPNSAHETLLSFSTLVSSFTFLFIVIW
ncbi:unnamed protein product [Malus baccata var. baccata]